MSLSELLGDPNKRQMVVDDCVALIDQEVAQKSGLSGLTIKGAYSLFKALRPGVVRHTVDGLLDEFVGCLEPYVANFQQAAPANTSLSSYLDQRKADVAQNLLSITDKRAQKVSQKAIQSVYQRLRPTAIAQVEQAMPRIGELIARHL